MFEPAEGVVPPEGSDSPDPKISEQEDPQKEENQHTPESDKAFSAEAIKSGTSEPDSVGELPRVEKPGEVESTLADQSSEKVREIETTLESTQEQANPSEEGTSVVLTPQHIETPKGPSPLTSTAVEAMRERQAARLRLAKLSNTGVESEAA